MAILDPWNFGGMDQGILGAGSWYSQLPQKGWWDVMDRPNSNVLGVPDWMQGIAVPTRDTVGMYFNVTDPYGRRFTEQQTDVGPAAWTGKNVDVSAAAADRMGYTPRTFPGGQWYVEPAAQGRPGGLPDPSEAMPGGAWTPENLPPRNYAGPPDPQRQAQLLASTSYSGQAPTPAQMQQTAQGMDARQRAAQLWQGGPAQGPQGGTGQTMPQQQGTGAYSAPSAQGSGGLFGQGGGLLGLGGGFQNTINSALMNPVTQFGLGLASGRTPQEGFGNALRSLQFQQQQASAGLTQDIKEYQYALQQGFKGSFQDWMKQAANFKQQFGLTPQWVRDANGNWSLVQLSTSGQAQTVNPPGGAGAQWAVPGTTINTGTGTLQVPRAVVPGAPGAPIDTSQQPAAPSAAQAPPAGAVAPSAGAAAPPPAVLPPIQPIGGQLPPPAALSQPPAVVQTPAGNFISKDIKTPALVKADLATMEPLAKKVAESRASIGALDQVINELATTTPQGMAGPISAAASRYLSAIGFPVTQGMTNAELLGAMTRQMVPSVREPGATSNYEQQMYMQAVPGLMQSADGRRKIATMNKAMLQRQEDIVEVYRRYAGSMELDGKLRELDAKPMFNKEQQRAMAGYNPPVKVTSPDQAKALPSGTKLILPDGSAGEVP